MEARLMPRPWLPSVNGRNGDDWHVQARWMNLLLDTEPKTKNIEKI